MVKPKNLYLAFDPEKNIYLGVEKESEVGYLMLENISDLMVVFKIRTDNENYLSVTPRKGILAPSDSIEVRIVYTSAEFRNVPMRLQVLAVPLDEGFAVEQRIQDVFQRASKSKIQDNLFTVHHALGHGSPKHPQIPSHKRSTSSRVRGPFAPLVVPSVDGDVSFPSKRPASWKSDNVSLRSKPRPKGTVVQSPKRPAVSSSEDTYMPHYNLHMSPEEAEFEESRFPLGRRLLKKFSQIGAVVNELTEQSRLLRNTQRWAIAFYWMALALLFLLIYFLIIYPLWKQWKKQSYTFSHGFFLPEGVRITEHGDIHVDDEPSMSLEEYINWFMN